MPLLIEEGREAPKLQLLYDRLPQYAKVPPLELRFGTKDAKGHYYPAWSGKPARIAVKSPGSVASFGHELGHHLQMFWSAEAAANWKALGRKPHAFCEHFNRWLRGETVPVRVQNWMDAWWEGD